MRVAASCPLAAEAKPSVAPVGWGGRGKREHAVLHLAQRAGRPFVETDGAPGNDEHAVTRGEVEGSNEVAGGKCRIDDDAVENRHR